MSPGVTGAIAASGQLGVALRAGFSTGATSSGRAETAAAGPVGDSVAGGSLAIGSVADANPAVPLAAGCASFFAPLDALLISSCTTASRAGIRPSLRMATSPPHLPQGAYNDQYTSFSTSRKAEFVWPHGLHRRSPYGRLPVRATPGRYCAA